MVSLCPWYKEATNMGEILLRVISGSARGLKLMTLDGLDTRPTLDRVKEALFSMLTPYLPGAHVLDLFAGSGALGIEALSRGSDSAVFVDLLPEALNIVRKNASLAGVDGKSAFFRTDALSFLSKCSEAFDIVFLDPPYSSGLYTKALAALCDNSLLSEDGVVVMEWDSALSRPCIPDAFSVIKERRYGRVMLTLVSLGA